MLFKKVYLYITLVMCRAGSKESAGLFYVQNFNER